MKHTIPAVIFAGGKSSRMGKDKALLPFGNSPSLAQYQYERLQHSFSSVYLSAKENKFDFPAACITDIYADSSPLVGLVSVFETVPDDHIFILSVDTPFIDDTIIDTLLDAHKRSDVTPASLNGELQPLCACYARSVLPAARQAMLRGEHSLKSLFRTLSVSPVPFSNPAPFMNLNHPEEYQKALEIIASGASAS